MKMKKTAPITEGRKFVLGILVGGLAALVISVILLACLSIFAIGRNIDIRLSNSYVFWVRVLSMFLAVLIGVSFTKEKSLLVSGGVSTIYFLLLLTFCLFGYDTSCCGFWVCALSVAIGGTAGCLIGLKMQNKRHGRGKANR